jgi:Xaa-Pro aminopeptidase
MHYRATEESNRAIGADEMLLVDSGGQYLDGTTDITRTIWTGRSDPPAEMCDRYTRVLKGHVQLATLQWPEGVAGVRLDALARRPLWEMGLDYDHGTGHGVGSFLSVHEGPVRISPFLIPAPLEAGMILSNEPGFYLPGAYGIRLENLVLVVPAPDTPGPKRFLRFETITLAPFARNLIERAMLTAEERAWIDAYHARVAEEVAPRCPPDVAGWLRSVCAPL